MPTTPAKVPADRKPKAKAKPEGYVFIHEGKTYVLPEAETVAGVVEGRYLRDAAMEGDEGQLRLGFAMLEKVAATPGAVDALYSMPASAMMSVIFEWMTFKPSKDEPSMGESSRSSV